MKYTYFSVANHKDLKEGEMKQVNADGTDILIAKLEGKVFAVGAHCTHYGAPLAKGALCGKHVICPWHHAWFDLTNGNLLEPPALDALPRYEVDIKDNQIFVGLPEERTDHRLPTMSCSDTKADSRSFIILGGGAAGYAAAQTLREDGFKGKITMITQEKQLPYDRPMLSKNYLQKKVVPKDIPLRPEDFFSNYSIDVLSEKEAQEVDHENKEIVFEKGDRLKYDSLLVATGGIPRKMDLPGAELSNILVLRSLDSAETIVNVVADVKKVVVVGASFIGMEAAASLTGRGLSVTVVAPGKVPFEKTLGADIGTYFKKLHEDHGVQFELGTHVKNFEGNGKVSAVILESGKRLEADAVITGIGVNPATDILKNIEKQKDGGVVTDRYLSLAPSLYAAGDIAAVPDPHTNEPRRIEHWRYALQQGFAAAHNMAGKNQAFAGVPFFWTAHFGVSLRYLGHAKGWDEIIYDGEVQNKKFLAFYITDGRITAIAGIGRDKDMAYMEQLFKDSEIPSAFDLKQNGFSKTFGSLIS